MKKINRKVRKVFAKDAKGLDNNKCIDYNDRTCHSHPITIRKETIMKTFGVLSLSIILLAVFGGGYASGKTVELASPDGNVVIKVTDGTHLAYEVLYKGTVVVANSRMGITIDNVNAGEKAEIVTETRYEENTTQPWIGIHDTIVNHHNGVKLTLNHPAFNTFYLDLRAFNDGVAFAFTVPGTGERTVQGEPTEFRLAEGSTVWYHDFYMHYETEHAKNDIADVPEGEWMAMPVTAKLKDDLGYLSISEAAIYNYCGIGLQSDGKGSMQVRLAHEQPASYPFVLRYGEEQAHRLAQPPVIEGDIVTPWRTIAVTPNLNALVNTDIAYNLSPEPDKKYFPEGRFADWLKPGRAAWGYLTTVSRTLDGMKLLSKNASEMGFEYHVVEGHWARWSVEQQKELIDYSRDLGVRVLVWKHSRDLWDPEERVEFFDHIKSIGAAGAKLDFFDHEAKEIIELYLSCLQLAAERQLVLNFHGASKPTGEIKTWPNELAREAIKGMEMRGPWAKHNVTVPFTRMVAGHADYTPLHFGDRKAETTDVHQIASAVIIWSPLLIYAADPADLLQHPAADVIKQIPSVWDETVVLEPSAIGEVAVFARRSGNKWFLAAMNGPEARTITINLSFLGRDRYTTTLVRDVMPSEPLVSFNRQRLSFGSRSGALIDTLPSREINDVLIVELLPAGGFVAVFEKE